MKDLMKDFFKDAKKAYAIAKEVPTCVKAFKVKNYQNNPTKFVDLSVAISKELEADYGLKGNTLKYLEDFVTDAIRTFDLVSVDIANHAYLKTLIIVCMNLEVMLAARASLVSAIMQGVSDAQSSSNTTVKQFKTDTFQAGVELFEDIILAICTELESTSTYAIKDEI